MLTGYVLMPTAMLAPRRVAGVKFSVLPIRVAMIFTMPTTAAVALPTAMSRPMIARHFAMIFAMLPPVRIGRVQVPMIPSGITVVFPMRAAWLIVAVVRGGDVALVALLRLGRSNC